MTGTNTAVFGQLLRRHRLERSLSQEELAERAGLSVRAISDLERGIRRSPYSETVEMLARALELTPEQRAELIAAVDRRRGPGAEPDSGAGASPPLSPLVDLPLPPTPLVGREQEVGAVRRMLLDPNVRMITLTGTGGTGKTRLALRVASDLVEEFPDGVYFVSLAPIADPELVTPELARNVGVSELGGGPLLERLREHLRPRVMLLVLDSFEQVLDAGPLVAELLTSAPRLKLLVTSRAALHISAEHEFPVPPLALPDHDRSATPAEVGECGAVLLFVQRARAVRPDFALTPGNAQAVVEICERLDGLPLAIELAAARAKVLSPEALLARLGRRLNLLTGGPRDLPARQQTVRATIEWSHNLLGEDDQTLFRRLGVFTGSWTLEAAEALCSLEGELDVVEALSALVDKSLVLPRGESRFWMLETVQEYALERLEEAGESERLRRLHSDYYLTMAEAAEPELMGPDQPRWLEQLEAEHDNLRAALSWLLDRGESEPAVRLARAIWRLWNVHGHLAEGRLWLERGLSSDPAIAPALRGQALNAAGYLAWMQGDYAEAATLLEESQSLRRESGDKQGLAHTLNNLGLVALDLGEFRKARALLDEGLTLREELGDEWGVALSLNNLGYTALLEGELELATSLAERSRELFRTLGNSWGVALTLTNLGRAALERADYDEARNLLTECLNLSSELGQRIFIAEALEGLAALASAQGDAEHGARLWGAAESLRESLGVPLSPAERPHYERHVSAARQLLDPPTFAAAWATGRTLTLDEALHLALGRPVV
ncbi:MAG: tetratricopeptide repeat protein [Chloroflexota bacterium]|nr:tetratricopeptide repeat protein [Chloroflexota bacterium]